MLGHHLVENPALGEVSPGDLVPAAEGVLDRNQAQRRELRRRRHHTERCRRRGQSIYQRDERIELRMLAPERSSDESPSVGRFVKVAVTVVKGGGTKRTAAFPPGVGGRMKFAGMM